MDTQFSKKVLFKKVVTPNKVIIINGIQKSASSMLVLCPKCERILADLGDIDDIIELNNYMRSAKDTFEKNVGNYCPSCGQKLDYDPLPFYEIREDNNLYADGKLVMTNVVTKVE